MNKKFLRIMACSLAVGTIIAGASNMVSAGAQTVSNYQYPASSYPVNYSYVSNAYELAVAANNSYEGSVIVLTNNITLNSSIYLKNSVELNLNGFNIYADGDRAIYCGKKEFSHNESYTITHPGYYTTEIQHTLSYPPDELQVLEDGTVRIVSFPPVDVATEVQVWHPETYETKQRPVYVYSDNVSVVIENGNIVKSTGRNGFDGIKDTWDNYKGEDGVTPNAPIHIISGTVSLYRTTVVGGNGGNGGNGAYQSLLHVVFGGGDGGKGGKGGDGGSAVEIERKESRVIVGEYSTVTSGNPGKGGKGSKANPHYWVYSGSHGSDGKNGKKLSPVNYL